MVSVASADSSGLSRYVGIDPLAHADNELRRIAQGFIEGLHAFIEGMDLQVDLHAAEIRKRLFCVPDQPGAQAVAALLRIDGDRIQPAAMPVIAGKELSLIHI